MPLRLIAKAIKLVSVTNVMKNSNKLVKSPLCRCQQSFYSSKPINQVLKVVDPVTGEEKKKKTDIIPKITLINDDELTVTTLEEAQKLSKRRQLKLVKIIDFDTKTQRALYKLMTGTEFHIEDIKQREQKKKDKAIGQIKGEKVLIINHNISEHDLETNIKKIHKWLAKPYEIRTIINGDSSNMDKSEHVYKYLENALKSQARFLQKRQKGSDIKFQIYPPKKEKNSDGTDDPDGKL